MNILDRLDKWKRQFGISPASELESLLEEAANTRIENAADLIRLHETVLFFRAYTPSPGVARLADRILFSFADRTSAVDSDEFAEPEVSGIAGLDSPRCSATKWFN